MQGNYFNLNVLNNLEDPASVHVRQSYVAQYFRRQFFRKMISVYKATLPENWNEDYTLFLLFGLGYLPVINTERYGVIPQHGTLGGRGVYYQPTKVLIHNPLLNTDKELTIGINTELLRLTPDYMGFYDTVAMYADMAALAVEAAGVNLLNSKLSYLLFASNKAQAETMKKLYDNVASGEPAVVLDKQLLNENGELTVQMFNQNLSTTFITPEILESLRQIQNDFCTAIGIPNANTEKRERMIVDEVNANNTETFLDSDKTLERLQHSCDLVNNMFYAGERKVWFDWRVNPMQTVEEEDQITNE